MKLYCLSGHPNRPCFVLKLKQTTFLLDCGLDQSTLKYFLPSSAVPSSLNKLPGWTARDTSVGTKLEQELKECNNQVFIDGVPQFGLPEMSLLDMSEVDVLLLSNYHCVLALPYITQFTDFKGVIYATEPTIHLARLLMEELVTMIENTPRCQMHSKWKQYMQFLPPPLKDVFNPQAWRSCYSKHDIHQAFQKVKTVGFGQKLTVFGGLQLTAVSSGFCIGSANWVIKSHHEKVSYVSGSSTLTTHPRPMSTLPLKGSDVIILSGLTQTPTANPDQKIGEFCYSTEVTLKNGGNVLVPCYPCGVIYDLIECLSGNLEARGLGQVPMYFISPKAKNSLAYSNIYAEWLSSSKQNKVFLPEQPFPHAELLVNNRLQTFTSFYADGFETEMRTPCVVFCGHPSLRFGDVVHFINLWGSSASNTIIFTEPDFPYLEALVPYQPLSMKVSYCPIDTSLNFGQTNKLVRDLKPQRLIVAENYINSPAMMPHRTELKITQDTPPITYRQGQVLNLPSKRGYEQVNLHTELANSLVPNEISTGIAVTMVTGSLQRQDNDYIYKPLDEVIPSSKKMKSIKTETSPPVFAFGKINPFDFAEKLKKQGLSDVKVEETPGGHIVHLDSEDTLIQLEDSATHIICQGNESLRIRLKDTLLQCLKRL